MKNIIVQFPDDVQCDMHMLKIIVMGALAEYWARRDPPEQYVASRYAHMDPAFRIRKLRNVAHNNDAAQKAHVDTEADAKLDSKASESLKHLFMWLGQKHPVVLTELKNELLGDGVCMQTPKVDITQELVVKYHNLLHEVVKLQRRVENLEGDDR